MNIRQLDLNLLLVFDAVYQERSISLAAEKLSLSQPAVSNALRRLRKFTNDTLFYRADGAMVPTRTANALAIPIRHALSTVEQSLSALEVFEPAISNRRFVIGATDFTRSTLIPSLMNELEREAPNVQIETVQQHTEIEAALNSVRQKNFDLSFVMPHLVESDPEISWHLINLDQLTLFVRKGHPLLESDDPLRDMKDARYVVTSQAPVLRGIIDNVFLQHGLERRPACSVPDTVSIPAIIEMTDLVGVIGRNNLARYALDYSVTELHSQIRLPETPAALAWSKTLDDDEGHQWLREKVLAILTSANELVQAAASD